MVLSIKNIHERLPAKTQRRPSRHFGILWAYKGGCSWPPQVSRLEKRSWALNPGVWSTTSFDFPSFANHHSHMKVWLSDTDKGICLFFNKAQGCINWKSTSHGASSCYSKSSTSNSKLKNACKSDHHDKNNAGKFDHHDKNKDSENVKGKSTKADQSHKKCPFCFNRNWKWIDFTGNNSY